MREMMEQILQGSFRYENGFLDFSCTSLELVIKKGENCEGSFRIKVPSGQYTTGRITSSDVRMEILRPEFVGTEEEIPYLFHGGQLKAGENVSGQIYVVSNQGEYELPFTVTVEPGFPMSSAGLIRNLSQFANLARDNWEEAVGIFYSSDFENVLGENDSRYLLSYRGMSERPGRQENMEEFLVETGQKKHAQFLVREERLHLNNPVGVTELSLNILRDGWGYTQLRVRVDGEFAFAEKEVLRDDDFLGNHCRLPIYIDSASLHRGRNYGAVIISYTGGSVTVPITVQDREREMAGYRLEKQRSLVMMMKDYQEFRLKKKSTAEWLRETGRIVERMVNLDDRDIAARLFQAQILITQQRYHEAQWLLDHALDLMEKQGGDLAVLEAYHLYLTTLIQQNPVYTAEAADRLQQMYRVRNGEWRIAWLLLYLSEDYSQSASGRWVFLESQYEQGCTSPILYLEALTLLHMNPVLLRKLGSFEIQVLLYGEKHEALSVDILEQLYYQAGKVKEYSELLYRILKSCYRNLEEERVLKEICTLLIKGNKVGPQYFEWYRRGIEAELRITQLYEYYIMSLDLGQETVLLKMALMYFSYQNNLDYRHTAYLYCYILKHRAEYPELYESYEKRMLPFVQEQIRRGRINRHLAALYQELLTEEMIDSTLAGQLARLLFACQIKVDIPEADIRNVIVYQPNNLHPAIYALNREEIWAALYGEDCTVICEDTEGVRYGQESGITVERLMLPEKLCGRVASLVTDCPELDLYMYERCRKEITDGEELERELRLLGASCTADQVKEEIRVRVMRYYYEQDLERKLEAFLWDMQGRNLSAAERAAVINYMVICGRYDDAYALLKREDVSRVDAAVLLRLLDERIERTAATEDAGLVSLAYEVYARGKYNGTILRYLVLYYQGPLTKLCALRRAARAFDIENRALCERLILQMLYTGVFPEEEAEIFQEYVSKGAGTEIEKAYLARCMYDYFVKDRALKRDLAEAALALHRQQEELPRIIKLACLKYFAAESDVPGRTGTAADRDALHVFLRDMIREGVRLNCFLKYREMDARLLLPLEDKTIVEYRAHPGARVWIHYLIIREDGGTGDYLTEEMNEAAGGVCSKEFILFFGETLQYYIVEERDGREQMTENGSRHSSDMGDSLDSSRYARVNQIVIHKKLQDHDAFDERLEEYYKAEFYNRELFPLV